MMQSAKLIVNGVDVIRNSQTRGRCAHPNIDEGGRKNTAGCGCTLDGASISRENVKNVYVGSRCYLRCSHPNFTV